MHTQYLLRNPFLPDSRSGASFSHHLRRCRRSEVRYVVTNRGFHVFTDRSAADAYLGSELAGGLMATDGFDNFQVQHFDVLDELSAMNGIPAFTA